MPKPTIVTRAGKGSALTWTEGDANVTNLQNATITVNGDSGSIANDLNGSFTISGGTGLTSSVASSTLTVNLDNTAVTPASYTIANFTVDQQGRLTAASSTSTTGSGNVVLATSPTLTTPILGTPTSGNLSNCTADGTNGVGFRVIPSAGSEKSSSYTLATSDRGEFVQVASGGSITVPNSTFAAGDVVVVYNNHTAAITITLSTTNAYIAGTNTNKTSVSLATRGVCNILFVSATVAILTGNIT